MRRGSREGTQLAQAHSWQGVSHRQNCEPSPSLALKYHVFLNSLRRANANPERTRPCPKRKAVGTKDTMGRCFTYPFHDPSRRPRSPGIIGEKKDTKHTWLPPRATIVSTYRSRMG